MRWSLHLPSLRDSTTIRILYLGLASQAIACRHFAAKKIVSQGKEARFALGSLQPNVMSGRGSTGRSRRKPAPPAHPTDDDDSTKSPSKASLLLLLEAKTNENKGLRKENKRLTKSLENMTEECDTKQGQIDELHSKMGVTKKTVGSDLDKKVRLVAFIFVCIGYLGGTPLNLCVSLLKDQAYGGQYRVH